MKWLIAPTSLKGSLKALSAAQIIAHALLACDKHAECILCPVADGGTDTLTCLIEGTDGRYFSAPVSGPRPNHPLDARWGVLGDGCTAVIESAEAAGLHLLKPAQYDPGCTTTYGVGQLIKKALDGGYRKLLIGLGGSATVDGGAGCLQALGVRLLDEQEHELAPGGIHLSALRRIDSSQLDPRLSKVEVSLLSDVRAVLCGDEGAAVLFGMQKGASSEQVVLLDNSLKHFGTILESHFHLSIMRQQGSGAAGGLGAGLAAVCKASIVMGIEAVLDILDFNSKLAVCDAVMTAEGKIDRQTRYGKAIFGVAKRARKFTKPVHAFAGRIDGDAALLQNELGLASLHAISPQGLPLEEAMAQAEPLLYASVFNASFG